MNMYKIFFKENFYAVLLFLIALSITYFSGNRGIFPLDSFSHFDTGYRILLGDHPFKDYWAVSGPFVDYLQSLFFFLFGLNWQIYIFHAAFINGIVALATFYTLLNLGLDKKKSFFYSVCCSILAYPSSGTPFVDHHSTFLSLLAIYALIYGMIKQDTNIWYLIPVLCILAFFSKQVPAAYLFFVIITNLIYHFVFSSNKNYLEVFKKLFLSSILTLIFIVVFFKLNSINFIDFFEQYILYPSSIGSERYLSIDYDFKSVFIDFKFIYLIIFIFLGVTVTNFLKQKKYFKEINFKVFLICLSLFSFLIHHELLTKNQIFIFFLIPILSGFLHSQLNYLKPNVKKAISYFLIALTFFVTIKYHQRFNVDRKFHELSNVNFSSSIEANLLSEKFNGLNWITPKTNSKEELTNELDFLKEAQKIIREDPKNKIVITNYSFFSILNEENYNSFSRWFPGDNSAFPTNDTSFYTNYKNFITRVIKRKKIESIYIFDDVSKTNLTDYVDQKCLIKKDIHPKLINYSLDLDCFT